ncbi:fasciclin domain-containing protein [Nocardioides dilutus]
MKRTTLRRSGAAATVLALSMTLAACGDDGDEPTSGSDDTSESTPMDDSSDVAGAGAQVFGDACSAIPTSGKGSFDGMVTDPVATAASNNPLLSTLVTAVGAVPGLADTLNGAEALTVFAPTNDAFAKIPEADLNALLADPDALAAVLSHHVVGANLDPDAVVGTQDTLNESTVTVEGDTDGMTVGDATVLCGNIPTANATVYVIDTVLMPSA